MIRNYSSAHKKRCGMKNDDSLRKKRARSLRGKGGWLQAVGFCIGDSK